MHYSGDEGNSRQKLKYFFLAKVFQCIVLPIILRVLGHPNATTWQYSSMRGIHADTNLLISDSWLSGR